MRHAKSSWDNPSLDDFDRPLNERGLKAAPEMARRFKDLGLGWSLNRIVSSSARRAAETTQLFSGELELEAITYSEDLYLSSPHTLLDAARAQDDEEGAIMLVAHNPGISSFTGMLIDRDLGDLPTAFLAIVSFEVEAWKDVAFGRGELVHLDTPKGSVQV